MTVDIFNDNKHVNFPWLKERTILLTKHGSHAYGLNTETSDLDMKGVTIAPINHYLGFTNTFEQAEGHADDKSYEYVIFELKKFFKLAADCNPNVIEILYTDDSDLLFLSPVGKKLRENRDLFLSRKAKHTFSGYAMSQLKRIRGHRAWLLDPPKAAPTRSEFNLPERTVVPADQLMAATAQITKQLDRWEFKDLELLDASVRIPVMEAMAETLAEIKLGADEKFRAAGRVLGFSDNFLEILEAERKYKSRQTEWAQYQNWKATRNPARAELEAKHLYDVKHGMHLVRLMRMCGEILTTGKVHVKRTEDRDELKAIRAGEWSYDRLVEWAEKIDKSLETVYKESKLPHAPDREKLDRLCIELVQEINETK